MSEARSAEDIIALKSEDLYNYGHQVKILSMFQIHYRINNPKEYCLSVLFFPFICLRSTTRCSIKSMDFIGILIMSIDFIGIPIKLTTAKADLQ